MAKRGKGTLHIKERKAIVTRGGPGNLGYSKRWEEQGVSRKSHWDAFSPRVLRKERKSPQGT